MAKAQEIDVRAGFIRVGKEIARISQEVAQVSSQRGDSGKTLTQQATARVFSAYQGMAPEHGTDTVPYTFGTRFTATSAGMITGFRFWLASRDYDGVQLKFALYPDGGGSPLAAASFTPSASDPIGWVDVPLATPYATAAGSTYMVAMWCPLVAGASHFGMAGGEWASYTASTGSLSASSTGGNGWFNYNSADISYPGTVSAGNNVYFVDVSHQTTFQGTTGELVTWHYSDANASWAPRPQVASSTTVYWINDTGSRPPANRAFGDQVGVRS